VVSLDRSDMSSLMVGVPYVLCFASDEAIALQAFAYAAGVS